MWTHAKNLRELKNDFFCQICKYLFLLQTTIAKISKFGFGLVEGAKLKSNISKLNFGIGVKKQCGTTCRVPNILFSKITPPQCISVSPVFNICIFPDKYPIFCFPYSYSNSILLSLYPTNFVCQILCHSHAIAGFFIIFLILFSIAV